VPRHVALINEIVFALSSYLLCIIARGGGRVGVFQHREPIKSSPRPIHGADEQLGLILDGNECSGMFSFGKKIIYCTCALLLCGLVETKIIGKFERC
jgi:hypothetical protein